MDQSIGVYKNSNFLLKDKGNISNSQYCGIVVCIHITCYLHEQIGNNPV